MEDQWQCQTRIASCKEKMIDKGVIDDESEKPCRSHGNKSRTEALI